MGFGCEITFILTPPDAPIHYKKKKKKTQQTVVLLAWREGKIP